MQKNIRDSALRLLVRRDHSQQELAQKLRLRRFEREAIDELIQAFNAEKLLNDERFAENYIYWRRNRGYGPVRISMELQIRGISALIIAEHLQITDNAWSVEAQKVWRKRFRVNPLNNIKEKAKQQRFLQQRGFTREHIDSVFDQNSSDMTHDNIK